MKIYKKCKVRSKGAGLELVGDAALFEDLRRNSNNLRFQMWVAEEGGLVKGAQIWEQRPHYREYINVKGRIEKQGIDMRVYSAGCLDIANYGSTVYIRGDGLHWRVSVVHNRSKVYSIREFAEVLSSIWSVSCYTVEDLGPATFKTEAESKIYIDKGIISLLENMEGKLLTIYGR